MIIKKVKGGLYASLGVLAGLVLFSTPTFAADLVYQENTTIRLGNGIELVIVGSSVDPSKIQNMTIGATTVTFNLAANDKLIIQSADGALGGRNLANSLSQAVTCFIRTGTQKESNLLIYGPAANVVITPGTTSNDCTIPTTSASNSVPSGGGGGGTFAPAPIVSPSPSSSPSPSPSPVPEGVTPSPSPSPSSSPTPGVPTPSPEPTPVTPAPEQPSTPVQEVTPPPQPPPPPGCYWKRRS